MTLEELQAQADRDLKIDHSKLDIESLKTPELHHKYLKYFNNFNLLLKKAEFDYNVLRRKKWEYFTGRSEPQVYKEKPFGHKLLKTDVQIYIDSDEELNELKLKIQYYTNIVQYLEQIIKMMNNRGFQIKNAIEFIKFTNGV